MPNTALRRWVLAAVSLSLVAGGLTAFSQASSELPPGWPGELKIKTLSNRADLISGGDALVRVKLPDDGGAFFSKLTVTLNGKDVTEHHMPGLARAGSASRQHSGPTA